jgi:predicted kinase
MAQPNLLIIRGAPGAGKSTIADALVTAGLYDVKVEVDAFMYNDQGKYEWSKQRIVKAREKCYAITKSLLEEGKNVVVANCFTTTGAVNQYFHLAEKVGATWQEMVLMEIPYKNMHDVPDANVQRIHTKLMLSLSGGA